MTSYENTNAIERVAKGLKEVAEKLGHQSELLTILNDPKTALKSNLERAQLNRALEVELQNIIDTKKPPKESLETSSNLPSVVAKQEKKAITYFNQNNEEQYGKVIKNIQKLRAEGKITYNHLGGYRYYDVIMPCGDKTVKMEFPPDTSLSDTNYNHTDFNGKEISKKETTRGKLWSEEGIKYVEQKEKKGQKMLSESEFKTLIQSLYPEGTEQEQILAFMMATGFYGRMRLSDKTGDFQRAVVCSRDSIHRFLSSMRYDHHKSSVVHSTFLG